MPVGLESAVLPSEGGYVGVQEAADGLKVGGLPPPSTGAPILDHGGYGGFQQSIGVRTWGLLE